MKQLFFNREISWLSFNYRVLLEATDKKLPIYERLKFMAIYSSNLDEFYKVRVATYRNMLALPENDNKKQKYKPREVLDAIFKEVYKQLIEFGNIYRTQLIPELIRNNIYILENQFDNELHQKFACNYFHREVLPHIQPVLLVKHSILSFLQDNAIYLVIRLYKKKRKISEIEVADPKYALIKIPTAHLPRFIEFPAVDGKNYIGFLDDVIRHNLQEIFPGFNVECSYSIKLSRDADLLLGDEFAGNLIEKIKKNISKRKTGIPARFLYDEKMPEDFLTEMMEVFHISKEDLVPGGAYHNFSDFFNFPNPTAQNLHSQKFPALPSKIFDQNFSLFKSLKNNVLLHFPYHSYDYVIRFLQQAAIDPRVTEIKATQYRVATNSAVVSALISAANNGKKVTVFVEVKARFDEENNLAVSKKMEQAGVKIINSIAGIKVHAKVALILRQSTGSQLNGYAFFSTGNFNEKTATIYSDTGMFTKSQAFIDETNELFEYLENQSYPAKFSKLLVAGFNMLTKLYSFIDTEIENAQQGIKSHIILKVNNLEDRKFIRKLYNASQSGVRIDLIVRGICCVVPNMEYSANIKITRIVDRYLEHARIFYFYNAGKPKIYISSADLMKRNLHRRIEIAVPILNEENKNELIDLLNIQLADNQKAVILNENHENIPVKPSDADIAIRAQNEIYKYLKDK